MGGNQSVAGGVVNGALTGPNLSKPNNISTNSEASAGQHHMDPVPLRGDVATTIRAVEEILTSWSGPEKVTIVQKTDNYVHAEFTTKLMKFVDDVEFYADASRGQLHFRSGSRVGHGDWGANRKRMTLFLQRFQG
eukprot:TRINITY_DN5564_c0_g1_i1.p1 TRINITY_DN5564_c0_g1~~TRINITY_DN5564_c0_g1_i1.p1  ORF type:complete len:135 (-),score=24.84 TRINITY_DN5564_c0_g1_i1:118-522(-)